MTEESNEAQQEVTETIDDMDQRPRNSSEEESDAVPESEFLKKLPPEARKVVEIGMSMHRFGPMPNPLSDKLTERHIDKILEISARDDEWSFKDAAQSRKFTLAYFVIFVVLFIFLTIFLVEIDKDLYKETVKLFAVFLGGFGGGFGVKSYMDRSK